MNEKVGEKVKPKQLIQSHTMETNQDKPFEIID